MPHEWQRSAVLTAVKAMACLGQLNSHESPAIDVARGGGCGLRREIVKIRTLLRSSRLVLRIRNEQRTKRKMGAQQGEKLLGVAGNQSLPQAGKTKNCFEKGCLLLTACSYVRI